MRRRLGGRWELSPDGPDTQGEWRVVLPTGLNFSPAGFVASAIAQADLDDRHQEQWAEHDALYTVIDPWQPASMTALVGSMTTAKSPERTSGRVAVIFVMPFRSASTSSHS